MIFLDIEVQPAQLVLVTSCGKRLRNGLVSATVQSDATTVGDNKLRINRGIQITKLELFYELILLPVVAAH